MTGIRSWVLLELVIVVMLSLILTGCSIGTVTTMLTTITAAAEIAVPAIAAAAGLDPVIVSSIMDYLEAVSTATAETAAELQTTDSTAVRAEKIALIWANVGLSPATLAILPPQIRTILESVVTAVQALLNHFATAKKLLAAPGSKGLDYTTSRGDRAALQKLMQRNTALVVTMKDWKKTHSR